MVADVARPVAVKERVVVRKKVKPLLNVSWGHTNTWVALDIKSKAYDYKELTNPPTRIFLRPLHRFKVYSTVSFL